MIVVAPLVNVIPPLLMMFVYAPDVARYVLLFAGAWKVGAVKKNAIQGLVDKRLSHVMSPVAVMFTSLSVPPTLALFQSCKGSAY